MNTAIAATATTTTAATTAAATTTTAAVTAETGCSKLDLLKFAEKWRENDFLLLCCGGGSWAREKGRAGSAGHTSAGRTRALGCAVRSALHFGKFYFMKFVSTFIPFLFLSKRWWIRKRNVKFIGEILYKHWLKPTLGSISCALLYQISRQIKVACSMISIKWIQIFKDCGRVSPIQLS